MAAVRPSPTAAVLALATELRAAGRDVISLGAGEPDFDTPQHIKDAAVAAISAGQTGYTPVAGTAELKAAIKRKFARENQLEYTPAQILVTCGAKQAIFNLCMALLGSGDEVIIPAPYWVSYPDMVRLADARPVIVEAGIEQDFKITPDQLRAVLGPDVKLFVLNSPSNPTGSSYSRAELIALGAVLREYPDVIVAADDIYEHIYWADEPFVSFAAACPDLADRTVTINGVSKAYAMTGWRIGYAAGPEALIKAMHTVQGQSTTNACSISQAAAVAALEGDQQPVRRMLAAYRERHNYFVDALNELAGFRCRHGEGTFYVFPAVHGVLQRLGLQSDTDLVERLLRDADVACVPGAAFGAPNYVRMSFACSMDELVEAIDRIRRVVSA